VDFNLLVDEGLAVTGIFGMPPAQSYGVSHPTSIGIANLRLQDLPNLLQIIAARFVRKTSRKKLRANYWVRVQLQPAADGDIKLIWRVAVAPGSTSSDPEMDSEFVPETVSTPDPLFVI